MSKTIDLQIGLHLFFLSNHLLNFHLDLHISAPNVIVKFLNCTRKLVNCRVSKLTVSPIFFVTTPYCEPEFAVKSSFMDKSITRLWLFIRIYFIDLCIQAGPSGDGLDPRGDCGRDPGAML